jgi:hypothetical protein
MPRSLIWLFSIASGLSVANVYYAQPLLDALAGISVSVTRLLAALLPPRNSAARWLCCSLFHWGTTWIANA